MMKPKSKSETPGLGAIPRAVVLVIGAAIWLAAYFARLPKWAATLAAVAVALVWMADHHMRTNASLSPERRRKNTLNLAIALALAGLVTIFYVGTMFRLGPNALTRAM